MSKSKYKTKWNLGLLYKNPKDPQIEKDLKSIEVSYKIFANKYRDKTNYLSSETALLDALTDYEKTIKKTGIWKPLHYFQLLKDIDGGNIKAEAEINKLSNRLTKASSKITFFHLALGKIKPSHQKQFLKSKQLNRFHYYLSEIFKWSKYQLTEAEEKILRLKSLPSAAMWINSADKFLTKQEILFKNRKWPLEKAIGEAPAMDTKERRDISKMVVQKLYEVSDFAEAEINAIYTNKKINDELRGLKNPYDNTLLNFETPEKLVLNLVSTVSKSFPISHHFYKLKAKLLKLPYLTYADRGAKMSELVRKASWEEAIKVVGKAFLKTNHKYSEIFNSYLKNGQIDVLPKKGKTGGAYCSGGLNVPTYVLLNFAPRMSYTNTIAHEMGHAIHTEFSKKQPVLYQGYTIASAEVASTLFENFVFDEIFQSLSKREQIGALHRKLSGVMSTVFRQIACFNFELELHQQIRKDGAISKEEIAKIMNKHMKSYLGPIVRMDDIDGYFFVYWSHIRRFFYVYSYALGYLISSVLYRRYKKDKKFLTKIEQFLSAGGSKSPADIFKDIGIDISKPSFFKEGLKSIEEDIIQLEKLAKEAKLI